MADEMRRNRSERIALSIPIYGKGNSSGRFPCVARVRSRRRAEGACFYLLTQDGRWYNVDKWPKYSQSRNSDSAIMSLVYRVSGPNAVRVFGGSHHEGEFLYPSS